MSVTFTAADRVGSIGGYVGGISSILQFLGGGQLLGAQAMPQNYVSREAFDLSMSLAASQRDNAILTAELNTEKKMVEVFNASTDKINKVRDELLTMYHSVDKKVDDGFAAQAVINCSAGSAVNLLQNQVGQLFAMTRLVIPNANICPGWDSSSSSGTT